MSARHVDGLEANGLPLKNPVASPIARAGAEETMDTVLIVEDSRPMQRTLQRLFESDGLQVEIASDGVAGLESFRKQIPGVVVLDLTLPRLPGKELCRAFKTHAAAVPVVVLSANTEVEDKVLLLELGADDYVTKPFSPKELSGASKACDAPGGRENGRREQSPGNTSA